MWPFIMDVATFLGDHPPLLWFGKRLSSAANLFINAASTEQLRRFRPDIMYFEGITQQRLALNTSLDDLKPAAILHIIEVGYGADTRLREKRAEKLKQHERLQAELTRSGWTCVLHVLIFGVGGSIFTETNQSLVDMGI